VFVHWAKFLVLWLLVIGFFPSTGMGLQLWAFAVGTISHALTRFGDYLNQPWTWKFPDFGGTGTEVALLARMIMLETTQKARTNRVTHHQCTAQGGAQACE